MCGLAGYAQATFEPESLRREVLGRMGEALVHRGPDDQGLWVHPRQNFGMVHRRLAVQDLSPQGHQPMVSASGRFIIAFNGEIYNFKRLRKTLSSGNLVGYRFDGASDTEVVLAAFEAWGVDAAIKRFNGMFAMAVVDLERDQLILIRDRLGEKPLYVYQRDGRIVFGSELKALMACPSFVKEINPNALALLLKHNYIPGPCCIFKNTIKVPPGHCAVFEMRSPELEPKLYRYWEPSLIWDRSLTSDSLHEQLEPLLNEVIADQMIADAPLGAFLSGGIDSSTIVALMQQHTSQPVKTFSVGFDIPGFNEAEHARAVANHLGTDHTEYYVSPADALNVIPDLPRLYDEPFADSSQVPTFIVSQMTRQAVTVALSGDGGDELFAGYERYARYQNAFRQRRQGLGRTGLQALPTGLVSGVAKVLCGSQRAIPMSLLAEKVRRHKRAYRSETAIDFYRDQISYWMDPEVMMVGVQEANYALHNLSDREDEVSTFQWADMNSYLPDDILVKVDRAAMANSLEARAPLLDHRLVELALRTPGALNTHRGLPKWPLRRILYQHVPEALIERPKQGFAMPKAQWLRGELREWAESLLSDEALSANGYFNRKLVKETWQAHQRSGHDYSFYLWSILMFQSWYREYFQ